MSAMNQTAWEAKQATQAVRYGTIAALVQVAIAHQEQGMSRRQAIHLATNQVDQALVARLGYTRIEGKIEVAMMEREWRTSPNPTLRE